MVLQESLKLVKVCGPEREPGFDAQRQFLTRGEAESDNGVRLALAVGPR